MQYVKLEVFRYSIMLFLLQKKPKHDTLFTCKNIICLFWVHNCVSAQKQDGGFYNQTYMPLVVHKRQHARKNDRIEGFNHDAFPLALHWSNLIVSIEVPTGLGSHMAHM